MVMGLHNAFDGNPNVILDIAHHNMVYRDKLSISWLDWLHHNMHKLMFVQFVPPPLPHDLESLQPVLLHSLSALLSLRSVHYLYFVLVIDDGCDCDWDRGHRHLNLNIIKMMDI